MHGRWLAVGLIAALVGGFTSACGTDDSLGLAGGGHGHEALQRLPWKNCSASPFSPPEPAGFTGWANRMKTRVAARPSTQDVIALPGTDVDLHTTFAYGLIGWRLQGESVDMFAHDCTGWQNLGSQKTNVLGEIDIPFASAKLDAGLYTILSNVLGDGTLMESSVRMLPADTRFIVLDIDGTLTQKGDDMVRNVAVDLYWPLAKREYVPQARIDAAAMTHKWHQKGYILLYLTGRPKLLRQDTLAWLKTYGFAPGSLHMTEHRMEVLPRIVGVGTYKAHYLQGLKEMGYHFDYAYGDAHTDLYAFKEAGIPRERTYYLGDPNVADRANIVPGSYTQHLNDMDALPDAAQPFDMYGTDLPE